MKCDGTLFDLYVDPGGASAEDIQELFESLSELNRAAGGTGLIYRLDDETHGAYVVMHCISSQAISQGARS